MIETAARFGSLLKARREAAEFIDVQEFGYAAHFHHHEI
jgi:hypothetical protein